MTRFETNIRRNMVFYVVAVLMALALKLHYSRACPGDLDWILTPTAGLVSIFSGEAFVFEAETGYVCRARGVIIAPACAGVNFLIMAFGMALFSGLHHMRRRRQQLRWLFFSLSVSYALTLGVNALRIMVSIYTLEADIFSHGLTWERVHRLEGVVIYFFFQYLFYSMIQKIVGRYAAYAPGRGAGIPASLSGRSIGIRKTVINGLTPCAWYLGITLAVPFLNSAAGKYGRQFYDHAAMVLSLCLLTWICLAAIERCGRGVGLLFTGGYRNHETQNPDC